MALFYIIFIPESSLKEQSGIFNLKTKKRRKGSGPMTVLKASSWKWDMLLLLEFHCLKQATSPKRMSAE